jgi:hypothetical protein
MNETESEPGAVATGFEMEHLASYENQVFRQSSVALVDQVATAPRSDFVVHSRGFAGPI